MISHFRRATLALAATVLLGAGSAGATSMYYGDLLTSDAFGLLPDTRATAQVAFDFSAFELDASWSLDGPGTGLGSAVIPPSKHFSHSFDVPDAKVEKAWLYVSFSDDGADLAPETAVVEFDGGVFETRGFLGWMWPHPIPEIVGGEVTGILTGSGNGKIELTVASRDPRQDFYIHGSLLKVKYDLEGGGGGNGGAVVPEPGGFLAFATGLLVTVGGLRRRRA